MPWTKKDEDEFKRTSPERIQKLEEALKEGRETLEKQFPVIYKKYSEEKLPKVGFWQNIQNFVLSWFKKE